MLNILKFITFVAALLLATASLATTTCATDDTMCNINQKKLQSMDQMGIKPVETKNESLPPDPADDKKKSESQITPFQIPKAGNYQQSPVLQTQTPVHKKSELEPKQEETVDSEQKKPQQQESRASIWR